MRKNAARGEFLIGNFESKEGVPAIPIDPKVFRAEETLKVEWVDIEFKDDTGTYFLPSSDVLRSIFSQLICR
jgi:hypothetical protein